jgi:hypothetical protein
MAQRGGGGGGGGGGSASTHTTLFGPLSAEAVEEHYRGQLANAGWRLIDHGATDRCAWSAWDFTGERNVAWTGLLIVIQPEGQAEMRQVSLTASAAYGGPSGGYSTMMGG